MKKIAIIGSGISGLTCAYHLSKKHEITLYEKDSYIGGHTHTIDVVNGTESASIDTGFIVFNDRTYPNFIQLMEEIGVAYQPTEMSFSVRNDSLNLEYNGHSISSLFAQRSNLMRPRFYKMLAEIVQFNRDVLIEKDNSNFMTIGDYLEKKQFSILFRDNYLLPMVSAIWSMGLESCYDFPLSFFARFFANHGLLDLANRPQWYTIRGGSSSYIGPLTSGFHDRIRLNSPVRRVTQAEQGVYVDTSDGRHQYDEVIFACHADQALSLLDAPTPTQRDVLGKFSFSGNSVILHTDTSLLPRRKAAWASWNYNVIDAATEQTTLTYNMNILQRLRTEATYLVSLNQEIDRNHVIGEYFYWHPIYTLDALTAQTRWHEISGVGNIHFCGAYWYNGFHEDGVRSGLRICNMLEMENELERPVRG